MKVVLCTVLLTALLLPAAPAGAEDRARAGDCIAARAAQADGDVTVAELRRACAEETAAPGDAPPSDLESPAEARKRAERERLGEPFALLAHRPTYLLPVSYNGKVNAYEVGSDTSESADRPKHFEAGFQISLKFPVWADALGSGDDLFIAYTNRSFWQLYDRAASSPFRSTDHEPELFWRHYSRAKWGPLRFSWFDIGLSHQSNGRSRPLSRSWNRVVGTTAVTVGDLALALRGWIRLPEDSEDDDNPDIEEYLGYGETRLVYAPNRNTFTMMLRQASNGGAVELTWSRQVSTAVRLYAQYYNGFGESLIDYDHRVERFSIGIALNDYLVNKN